MPTILGALTAGVLAWAGVGCASTPPPAPAPEPPQAPTPVAPVTPVPAPAPPETPVPIAPGPWILLDAQHAVLADGVQASWFDKAGFGQPDRTQDRPGIWLPAIVSALPESARRLVDTPLVLLTSSPERRCPVKVKALWAASIAVFDEHEGSAFYRALGELSEGNGEVTPAQAAAKAWESGHRLLVAELVPASKDACEGPLLAARADAAPKQLALRPAPGVLKAKALKALRASAFWDIQQEAYQKSLVVARVRYREQLADERKRQLADGTKPNKVDLSYITDPTRGAPKTWDTPVHGEGRPEVDAISDADGTLRFIRVKSGNNLSCAAPVAWALFDPDFALVDFGLAPRAQLILDWDGDGALDLYEGGWHWGAARALERPGHPQLAGIEVQPNALSCYWEQIGPLPEEPSVDVPKPP